MRDDAGVEHRDRDARTACPVPCRRQVRAAVARARRRLEVPLDLTGVVEEFVVGRERGPYHRVDFDQRHGRIGAQPPHGVLERARRRQADMDEVGEVGGRTTVGQGQTERAADATQARLGLGTGGEPAARGFRGKTDDQPGRGLTFGSDGGRDGRLGHGDKGPHRAAAEPRRAERQGAQRQQRDPQGSARNQDRHPPPPPGHSIKLYTKRGPTRSGAGDAGAVTRATTRADRGRADPTRRPRRAAAGSR